MCTNWNCAPVKAVVVPGVLGAARTKSKVYQTWEGGFFLLFLWC